MPQAHTSSCHDEEAPEKSRTHSHLFIEMEESHHFKGWFEVGRWNHALEEDLVDGQQWSRPHLPTLSVPALVHLRQALGAGNVMLDFAGPNLSSIIDKVIERLIKQNLLPEEARALAKKALSGAHRPNVPKARRRSIPGFRTKTEAAGKDFLRMLEPDKGEEALDLLLAHVPFVQHQIPAFVRLKSPIDAGLESHSPVRYLFILLGPEEQAADSGRMAHALAGMMLDESFVALVQECSESADLLRAFDAHLEDVAILPHVHMPHGHGHGHRSGAVQPSDTAAGPAAAPLTSSNGQQAGDAGRGFEAVTVKDAGPKGADKGDDSESSDEDEVILDTLEDKLRSRKGMHKRSTTPPKRKTGAANEHASKGTACGLQRRPSFSQTLADEVAPITAAPAVAPQEEAMGLAATFLNWFTERLASPKAEANAAQASPQSQMNPLCLPLSTVSTSPAHAAASLVRHQRYCRLFIELVQLNPQHVKSSRMQYDDHGTGVKNSSSSSSQGWVRTHHWNWGMGQERDGDGGWTRPHLPTISANALVHLLRGLGPHNVILGLEGSDMHHVARSLVQHLVSHAALPESVSQRVIQLLQSREAMREPKPVVPPLPVIAAHPLPSSRRGAPSTKRARLNLQPDADEEAFELLVAHVDFVHEPMMAFARLAAPIQTGCEGATPVRFLFLLLGPLDHATRSSQMATAFASIMLDNDFVAAVKTCGEAKTFHNLLVQELDCVTIVPTSHMPHQMTGGSATASARKHHAQRLVTAHSAAARSEAAKSAASGPAATHTRVALPKPLRRSSTFSLLSLGRSHMLQSRHNASAPIDAVDVTSNASATDSTPSASAEKSKKRLSVSINDTPALVVTTSPGTSPMRNSSLSPQQRLKQLPCSVRTKLALRNAVHECQAYSLPLLAGIVVALIWANVHNESYVHMMDEWSPLPDHTFVKHRLTVKFVVNDVFMVFFFGIAAKEITEACLPGGSLNPPRKAISPLIGTVAGVLGPIGVYVLLVAIQYHLGVFDQYESSEAASARLWLASHAGANGTDGSGSGINESNRITGSSSGSGAADYTGYDFSSPSAQVSFWELFRGWGVPTATDISLAWTVAVQVFPLRHPAIEFLLLLAVADDAIGLAIIAIAYGDPAHQPEPFWLLLVVAGMVATLLMRWLGVRWWQLYVLVGGTLSWVGLANAALHPAIALVFIVPLFPPANRPRPKLWIRITAWLGLSSGETSDDDMQETHDSDAPLHAFEHQLKVFIDFGMFFFTLANAGVKLSNIGAMTFTILGSLVAGKMIFITSIVLMASRCKIAPLNSRITASDLTMTSAMATIGLTVALFIAGEAFTQERLQAEAKMGALLSGLMGAICLLFARTPMWKSGRAAVSRTPGSSFTPNIDISERDVDIDDEEDLNDDIASIVESTLEYQISRATLYQRERKGILNSLSVDAMPSPGTGRRTNSPNGSSRRSPGGSVRTPTTTSGRSPHALPGRSPHTGYGRSPKTPSRVNLWPQQPTQVSV